MSSQGAWSFSLVQTLAVASVGWWSGSVLVTRVRWLHRFCLPAPVIGGLLLCLIFSVARSQGISIEFDLSLQTPLMTSFFLSIGWLASLRSLRRGGPQVLKFLLICSGALLIQNLVGVTLAQVLGQKPLLGILAGSISLTGGPGTALAFAPLFEAAGISSAGAIGTTCALVGILLGGVLGSPLAIRLISKRHETQAKTQAQQVNLPDSLRSDLPRHLGFFLLVMALGNEIANGFQTLGVTLPVYIGSMVVAAVLRNIQDYSRLQLFSESTIEDIGSVALAYFLVVATMTLQIHQVATLASALFIILAAQAVVVLLLARFFVFRWMGRDHDAAVMSGGFVGFMLGTTANAVANMNAVTSRCGPAPRAYLVVPLVGACFIDFINALAVTFLVSIF